MVVPVILDCENNGLKFMLLKYLRFLDLCVKNEWPIITHSEYEMYEITFPNRNEYTPMMMEKYDYKLYSYNERMKVKHYFMPTEVFENVEKRRGSKLERALHFLNNRDDTLEKFFVNCLDDITKNEAIDAVLYFAACPLSVKYVCRKRGIKMISYETGPIRMNNYRCNTSYFCNEGLYCIDEIKERWNDFTERMQTGDEVPIFSREELLLMFLHEDNLKYVGKLDSNPRYEIGVAGGCGIVVPYFAQSKYTDHELIDDAFDQYDFGDVLVRLHPGDMYSATYRLSKVDKNESPFVFLTNTKRVAAVGSNMLFEAMLWKRIACCKTNVMPATFFCSNDYKEDREKENMELFVNFFLFSFLVPMEIAFDYEYIKWRLDNPSETDIYRFHLKYYLSKFGLNMMWTELEQEKRKEFLKMERNYTPITEEEYYLCSKNTGVIDEGDKEYLDKILNSTSWKMTAPMRYFADKIRGYR